MTQKTKSYYITVTDEKHKTVFTKMLFNVKEANEMYKEMREKYKDMAGYTVFKEHY